MTETEIFDIIWGWVDLVINKTPVLVPEIVIVFSRQNAPVGVKTYITIQQPLDTADKSGSGNQGKADENGIVETSDTWAGVLNIQEVGTGGDYLRKLENTLTRQSIRDYFQQFNFSVLRFEPVLDVTRKKGNEKFYIKGASVDIHVAFTDTDSYETGYIGSIGVTSSRAKCILAVTV